MAELTSRNDCYGVELHVHLDGSVPCEVIWNAAKRTNKLEKLKQDALAQNPSQLLPFISVGKKCRDLVELLSKMYNYHNFLVDDKESLCELCRYFVKQQFEQKIYYTETRYCPHLLCQNVLTPEEVVKIISTELNNESKKYGIIVKSILCCMREWLSSKQSEEKILNGKNKANEIVAFASKYKDNVVGVDLAGDEHASGSRDGYKEIFDKAKSLGLHVTIHAGESGSSDNIIDALENLNAERIGHGYHVIENSTLLKQCAINSGHKFANTHFECCPTSSVITNSIENITLYDKSWTQHPINKIKRENISYSISTDDPGVMRCSYQGQLQICLKKIGFTNVDIQNYIRNAAKSSFLDGKEKNDLINEIEFRLKEYFFVYDARDKDNDHESISDLTDLVNKNNNIDNNNQIHTALASGFVGAYKNIFAYLFVGAVSFWIIKYFYPQK